jgi:hypothetical protein
MRHQRTEIPKAGQAIVPPINPAAQNGSRAGAKMLILSSAAKIARLRHKALGLRACCFFATL